MRSKTPKTREVQNQPAFDLPFYLGFYKRQLQSSKTSRAFFPLSCVENGADLLLFSEERSTFSVSQKMACSGPTSVPWVRGSTPLAMSVAGKSRAPLRPPAHASQLFSTPEKPKKKPSLDLTTEKKSKAQEKTAVKQRKSFQLQGNGRLGGAASEPGARHSLVAGSVKLLRFCRALERPVEFKRKLESFFAISRFGREEGRALAFLRLLKSKLSSKKKVFLAEMRRFSRMAALLAKLSLAEGRCRLADFTRFRLKLSTVVKLKSAKSLADFEKSLKSKVFKELKVYHFRQGNRSELRRKAFSLWKRSSNISRAITKKSLTKFLFVSWNLFSKKTAKRLAFKNIFQFSERKARARILLKKFTNLSLCSLKLCLRRLRIFAKYKSARSSENF